MKQKNKFQIFYLFILLLLATALTSCGTYDTSPNKDSQSDTDKSPGLNYTAVSFSLTIDDNPGNDPINIPSPLAGEDKTKFPPLQGEGQGGDGVSYATSPRTLAKLDCTASSIATIEITVYDSTGTELVKKSFNCTAHSGNIEVPSGGNRKFVFSGKNSSGVEVYRGEQNSVNLQSGIPVNIGEVKLETLYLLPPIGLTAIAGDGQNTISWNTVTGATAYNIYWSTSTVVTKVTGTKISNVKSPYIHTGLSNGTTYRYVVTAVNSYGESGESDQTSAKYTSVITLDTTAPANTTGTNFINSSASATNSTSVTLSISATDSVGVTGYYASENSTNPSASDSGWKSITPTTSYLAGVSFTLSSGDGAKTVYVWFKDAVGNVSSVVSDSITLATTPSAPTNVTPAASDTQATIRWGTVSNATSYNIYWSATSGVTKSTGAKISGITATSYTHTGLTNGTAYYYVVTAVNDYGESWESNQVMVIPPQIPISLPKTGQTICYDSLGNVIACAGTGQDGDLQRGVAWPTPRFTDNGDSTVTDNLTGLDWTKDGNAPGPSVCSPAVTKTWQAALDYVECLNTNSYLGYTDWRLPNINELESLVNAGQSKTNTWLNSQGFNNVQSDGYWSSTTSAYGMVYAWIVSMWYGSKGGDGKSGYNYVWPVRSGQAWLLGTSTIFIPKTGQTTCYNSSGTVIACSGTGQDGELQRGVAWPNPRFRDNGDSTVTDNLTGLIWTKDPIAPGLVVACFPAIITKGQAALDYVACLNSNSYLGYTDWRLPNINELRSLVHAGQSDTATWLNTQGFKNVPSDGYWTSTTYSFSTDGLWFVGMGDSRVRAAYKSGNGYVWPVRSGQ